VLVLWVTEVNDRAKAFYRRMGFTPTGARQPVRPDEPDHIEAQMILDLG
jgi:ribosomal protein S18 acetylase RimI-like enzyme